MMNISPIPDNQTWPVTVASMRFLWTKTDVPPVYEIIEYVDEEGETVKYDPEYCFDLGSQPPPVTCPDWVYRYHLAIEKEHKERIQIREDDIRLRDLMVSNLQRMEEQRQANIELRKKLGLDYSEFLEPLIPKEVIRKQKKMEEERKRREANINIDELPHYRKRKRDENIDLYVDYWMRPPRSKAPKKRKVPSKSDKYRRPPTPENPCPFRC